MSVRITIILNLIFGVGIVFEVTLKSVQEHISVRQLQTKSEALQIKTDPLLNNHL